VERNKKYKAFISYSHTDQQWAKWVHRSIETYRVPKYLVGRKTTAGGISARLTPIFRDREDLPSAPDLSSPIHAALQNSENLIVVCSPASARSLYVNEEIKVFKSFGRSDRIFCVIVDGDPSAVGSDSDCFAPALRTLYDEQGREQTGSTEPIAADARGEGDGKPLAHLKLIAGMLGLDLDDLRQREQQRKYRRMAAIMSGSLIALAVTVVLAINAVIARNEADQRRQQAEGLLSFMVGDLHERLEPIGRLDVLEDVGTKAMEYYATVKASDLTDTELLRHAQVLTQLGEIRISQRQFDDALESFSEALERSEEHFNNDPTDGERLFNRSQAEYWVGYVYWLNGDLDSTRDWFTRYLRSSEQLSEMAPSRSDWTIEVVYANHNLAVLALESGDLVAANAGFLAEVAATRVIYENDPTPSLKQDLADAVSWLGNIALERGDLPAALEYYQEHETDLRELRDDDAANKIRQQNWAESSQLVTEVALMMGNLNLANSQLERAIPAFEALVLHDESNQHWVSRLATSLEQKGHLLARRGEMAAAIAVAERGIRFLENLDRSGSSDTSTDFQFLESALLLATFEFEIGNFEVASILNAAAVKESEQVEESDRLNHERAGILSDTYLLRHHLLKGQGDLDAAQAALARARQSITQKAMTSNSPYVLDAWARVLKASGEDDKALEITKRLLEMQFVPF
jgi:tetratricopeptide (TPR) repeat protein